MEETGVLTAETGQKILGEIGLVQAMLASKMDWVSKDVIVKLTGLHPLTINNMVSQKRIIKRGLLYSYRSFVESQLSKKEDQA